MSTTGLSLNPVRVDRLRQRAADMSRAGCTAREIAAELSRSQRTVERYLSTARQTDQSPVAATITSRLTSRQREVLALVAEGRTNPQIAAALGIALDTVKSHVEAILVRLGATSRWQAIVIGVQAGELS